ncbi:hypothetical protein Dsin_008287 [Dipteronia sinensis]|uniref:Uncharacterized protein n=1 Tax=Dipteronia sinensis TaxID=43782 RepID=A0AAE0APM9_9ROSI|nr:hypothetical protein Dsin_008287 [Dipteronia sinensis]
MCFGFVCEVEERELGRQQAPGSCPHCGGKVVAMDVERQCRFCFLPVFYKIKQREREKGIHQPGKYDIDCNGGETVI